MSITRDFLKNTSKQTKSPVKDFLSQETPRGYFYTYEDPASVGPPVEPVPEDVGLGTILAEGFGTLKAVPSAGLAGYQGSQAEAIDEANRVGWGQALLDFSRMNPNTLINKTASSLNPEMMQARRNEFAQDQAANLQEALAIGEKEARDVEELKQRYAQQGGSQFAADVAAGVGGSLTSVAPLAGAVATGALTRSPRAALLAQQALAPIPAIQAYAQSYAEFKRQYPDAPEEEAQNYAKASAGLEYAFEAVPGGVGKLAGTGLGQVAGEVAKRTGREVLFETATEANQQLLQSAIAPELAPETATDAAYNMALAGTTAGLLSGPITTFGVRGERNEIARRQEQKRLEEAAAKDAEIARGMQAAQEQDAVRQAEEAIAELNKLTDRALNRNKGDTNPLFGESAFPRVEEPAPVQEAITFPEQVPLQQDIFGNEVEARVMTPPSEVEAQASELEAKARTVRETTTAIDDRIDSLVEQKAQIVPTGPKGGYTRADRVAIDRFDRQILNLQARKRELETGAVNIEATATSARLDLPSESTRPEAEVRQDYLLTMQGRQFDQAERARLGEMEAQGEGATPDLFQPTKPRVRAELEPEQGALPLPKPRIRVGESLEQQGPALSQPEAPRPVQAPLEGPTMELPFNQPKRQAATRDLSAEAEGPAREAQRLSDARKVYVQDLNTAKSDLTKARKEANAVAESIGGVQELRKQKQEAEARGEVFASPMADRLAEFERLDEVANQAALRVREAEFTLGRFDRLSKRDQAKGGTTPAPRTQTAPVEAPSPVSGAPLSRGERVALANLGYDGPEIRNFSPAQARSIVTNQIRKGDFEAPGVDIEGNILPDVRQQGGVAATDTAAREALFSQPRAEPISGTELNNAQQADIQAVQANPQANVVPAESRAPSVFEKKLAGVSNARGAMKVIRSMVLPDSPFVKILDALDKSPFLNDVPVVIVQPGDRMPRSMESPTVRGVLQPYVGGKNAVFLRGSGFRLNGTQTPEIALHEIVHAASVDLIDGVNKGRIKDPKAIVAVKQIDTIRKELAKALQDKETREGLTGPEKVNLDYATKNSKEFVSQALSSSAMQSGLKKENLWSGFVNGIRNLFRGPRSTAPLWDKIVDASLSVVEVQTELEATVRASRAQAELEPGARRADSLELEDADAADIPTGNPPLPTNLARQTPERNPVKKAISRVFTGPAPQVLKRAEERARGLAGAEEYVGVQMTNALNLILKNIEKREGLATRKKVDKDAVAYLRGERKGLENLPEGLKDLLDRLRRRWDANTIAIIQEIEQAFEGKDIPKEYVDKIKTLKSQIGKFTTRIYQQFADPKYGERTWAEWEAGKDDKKKRNTPGYKRVSDFTSKLGQTIGKLPQKIEDFKQQAEELGGDFEPWEMATRSDLKDFYETLVGNPDGKSVKEMFEDLEVKAKDIKGSSALDAAEIVAKILLDPEKGDTSQGHLFQYYRNLATDDTALRKRHNINSLVRNLWGEAEGVMAIAMATSARQGAIIAGLRSLNDVYAKQPTLFSEAPSIERTKQIPNNPQKYGALAGRYTDPITHDSIVQFMTVAGYHPAVTTYNRLAGTQKKFMTVYNPRAWIQELLGGPVVMMANGLPPTTKTIRSMKDALDAAGGLVATAFRGNHNELTEKVLKLGLIEPVVTGGIKRESRQAQLEDAESRTLVQRFGGKVSDYDSVLREAKESIEVFPGLAVFFDELNYQLSRRPELAKAYAAAASKPPESRTRQERLTIREMEALEDAVANRTKETTFAFSRAPAAAKFFERYGLSSFGVYMADTFRVAINSYRYGMDELRQGLKTNDTELRDRGVRKIIGAMGASVATPVVTSAVLATDIKVLGGFALMGLAGALGEGDEDEIARDMAAMQAAAPFSDQTKTLVFAQADDDMTVWYTDAGRWEALDPSTSAARGLLAGAYKAVQDGDYQMLQDTASTFASNFFGGSALVDTAKLGYRAYEEAQAGAQRVKPSIERRAPDVMETIYGGVAALPGVDYADARRGYAVAEKMMPMVVRNIPAFVQQIQEGNATKAAKELIGEFSTPWNVKDELQNNGFASMKYRSEMTNARRKALGDLVTQPTEVSEQELREAFLEAVSLEQAALDEMQVKVEAYRAVNRQLDRRPDAGLREVLTSADLGPELIDMAIGSKPFVPREIKEDFLKQGAEASSQRALGVSERGRQLPENVRQRVQTLQRIRQEWIRENR